MMNTIAQWMAMQIMKDIWYRVENEIHTENEMCESVRPTHPSIHTHDNHEGSDGWRAEREAERT